MNSDHWSNLVPRLQLQGLINDAEYEITEPVPNNVTQAKANLMIIETEGTAGHACIRTPIMNLNYHIMYHIMYHIVSYHTSYHIYLISTYIISSCIISCIYHIMYLSYHVMSHQHLYISWGPIRCASLDSCSWMLACRVKTICDSMYLYNTILSS